MHTVKEAINLASRWTKHDMPVGLALSFWAPTQDPHKMGLTDAQIVRKTFARIKMIEGLVKRDSRMQYIDPSRLTIVLFVKSETKADGSKSYNLWTELVNLDQKKISYSFLYKDCNDGNAYVLSGDKKILFMAKNWTELRRFFNT